ncbi:hypothetical protein [Amycolatopsis sp. CA-128772]|uniref:hypothetical protein n=1 Tax=Amycolatopsis sp. CA-128772 TaxID=2073159 RepID=UPI000CD2ED21|nr:hypothetical protein [Amycolatopsis sp. CA-128772]
MWSRPEEGLRVSPLLVAAVAHSMLCLAERGRQVQLTGVAVSVIVVEVVGFVSTVIGLVLLYLPASNAYVEGVRALRSGRGRG